jgi:hypothetical protein
MAGTLVGGSVFWPYQDEVHVIRIDTTTMDVSGYLPSQVEVVGFSFGSGEIGNGELCIVYESGFFLYVWIRRRSVDRTEIWPPPTILSWVQSLTG